MRNAIPLLVGLGLILLTACEEPDVERDTDAPRETPTSTGDGLWQALQEHCGEAFEGTVVKHRDGDQAFVEGPVLVHFRKCEDTRILAPLAVGENLSRTWVLERDPDGVSLRHEHRGEDGYPETLSGYGGLARPPASEALLEFPADDRTVTMLPDAVAGIWTLGVEDNTLIYQVRREGTDRIFRVEFDLEDPVEPPDAPWGWEQVVEGSPGRP